MRFLFALLALVLFAAPAAAQRTASPGTVAFECPDHDEDTDHELGYFLAGATDPVQALRLGDPAAVAGTVTAVVPARPLNLGQYVLKVRAYVGALTSAWGAGGPAGDQPVPFDLAPRHPVNLTRVP